VELDGELLKPLKHPQGRGNEGDGLERPNFKFSLGIRYWGAEPPYIQGISFGKWRQCVWSHQETQGPYPSQAERLLIIILAERRGVSYLGLGEH
jgi:hypothetical protein